MGKYKGYHTALEQPVKTLLNLGESCKNIFQYDLFDQTYPDEFKQCEVFCSDLPWKSGFSEFERRGGKSGRTYDGFLKRVISHIQEYQKPTVLITGEHAKKRLAGFDHEKVTTLHGMKAIALFYRLGPIEGNSVEICQTLAQRYDVVGDFCAGFGRTGAIFEEAGKQFVLSDYNPDCVRHMNERFASC